ncbi:MAG TPA: formate dehydrogenase accessory sulfurtransferase FdhD [Anaerolineae bacterium]|nr:formate dehydrogenase accessory sulfurtransferase FdhD [Anaerolineae bacterium]HQK14989.1 formate dehydrogenase accessory sulfurtransferase FdhD [Anaerolineae bacterium]
MNNSHEHQVHVWRQGEVTTQTYTLPGEEEFCIYVNGQSLVRLMASPMEREALVIGFLAYAGVIETPSDIVKLHFSEGETCADVWLTADKADAIAPSRTPYGALLTSGCGRGVVLGDLYAPPAPLPVCPELSPVQLLGMAQVLQEVTTRNPDSHGVHTSALFTPNGNTIAIMTDVGRHNTLDKLLGYCLLKGYTTEGNVLLTTGRLSSEMVSKAARMGVPVTVTLRAVTSTAMRLAEAWGITTVGYLRGQQMVIHTHPERLGIGRGRLGD